MQVAVHFAVGMAVGLVLVLVGEFSPREEFAILMGNGFWATLPDSWWFIREYGFETSGLALRAIHRSVLSNVFWFHGILDGMETGNPRLEGAIGITLMFIVSAAYFLFNNWPNTREATR